MLSSTLNTFKIDYDSNLSSFLNNYEDNTESIFLENELKKYNEYSDSLISIKKCFKNYTVDEIKSLKIYSGVAAELKKIDEDIYYSLILELKKDGDTVNYKNLTEEELLKDLIVINFEKLNNHITSAQRILDHIRRKLETLTSLNKHSIPLYETSKLSQDITKQQSSVLEDPIKNKDSKNLYPRIFITNEAYMVFHNLLTEFKVSKQILADYSFVYHKMVKDNLIYPSVRHKEYFKMLGDFDINIDRIKSVHELGNSVFRDSIYTNAKNNMKS